MKLYALQGESIPTPGKFEDVYYRSEDDMWGHNGESIADYALAETLEKMELEEGKTYAVECVEGYNYLVRLASEEEYKAYKDKILTKLKQELAEREFASLSDGDIIQILIDGCKGYDSMTEEELNDLVI